MLTDLLFRLFAVLAALLSPAPAPEPAPAPVVVVEPAPVVRLQPDEPAPVELCPDGTNRIPVAGGELGCPGPAAVPGPVGVPPGFTAVPWPEETLPPVPPADPCFEQDPECYGEPPDGEHR